MARIKNALTGHFIGPVNGDADKELAKWITDAPAVADDTVESAAYYDGDGTEEENVTGTKLGAEFTGTFDKADPAQKMIYDMKLLDGDGRKVLYKQVEPDGTTLEGIATVTNIVAGGGAAGEYAPFGCRITWDKKPVVTLPVVEPIVEG